MVILLHLRAPRPTPLPPNPPRLARGVGSSGGGSGVSRRHHSSSVLLLLPRPISIGVPSGQPAARSSSSGQPPLASPPPGPRLLLPQLQQPAAPSSSSSGSAGPAYPPAPAAAARGTFVLLLRSTSIGAHKWGQWNSGQSHSVQIIAYARGPSEFFWMPCVAIDMNGKAFEGYSKQAAGS